MTILEERMTGEGRLLGCLGCQRPVPLRLPRIGEEAESWACVSCGAELLAVLVENCPSELRASVRRVVEPPAHEVLAPTHAREALPTPRGIRTVLETDISRSLDRSIDHGDVLLLPEQGRPFLQSVKSHGTEPYDKSILTEFTQDHLSSASQMDREFGFLCDRGSTTLATWRALANDMLTRLGEDRDLFTYLATNTSKGNYPSYHSLQTAMLAMSIGTTLRLDKSTLIELAVGCFLHDSGMSLIGEVNVHSSRVLSYDDRVKLAAHPILTTQLLRNQFSELSETARMVLYQMHERCDGGGYPAGRTGAQIHPAAKIAAIADAYVALCSARQHRPPLLPYYAVVTLLNDLRAGYFDATIMRAFLQTVSLFPVGSYVTLGSDHIGRVLRANPDRYDRPVIELWLPGGASPERKLLDLSQNPTQWQPRPIEPPGGGKPDH